IKRGLKDFSISRTRERAHNWGVPVPNDPDQIIYVWYDALANYITALDYAKEGELFKKFWVENPNRIHVIGKGISRFHAIYWPVMLKSANLPIPTTIFIHGYVTSGGQKISKSLGNAVDPFEQVKKYGTDALRYYLLREIPAHGDGDYTEEKSKEVYNADLANGLGNLVSRVSKLCENADIEIGPTRQTLKQSVERSLQNYDFAKALNHIWGRDVKWGIKWLDQLINERKPWSIEDKKGLELSLNLFVSNIRDIAYNLKPFLPETAEKIENQFAGPKIKSARPLFPRLA
ncbi:MAG: class I tRNA ligase family protein, partial [Patescibacteria group bacterium]